MNPQLKIREQDHQVWYAIGPKRASENLYQRNLAKFIYIIFRSSLGRDMFLFESMPGWKKLMAAKAAEQKN